MCTRQTKHLAIGVRSGLTPLLEEICLPGHPTTCDVRSFVTFALDGIDDLELAPVLIDERGVTKLKQLSSVRLVEKARPRLEVDEESRYLSVAGPSSKDR